MFDIAVLQSVSYVAAAIGVCVAAAYYVLNLRNTIQNRKAQLYMQLGEHLTNPAETQSHYEILLQWEWKDFDDFQKKYGLGNLENFAKFMSLGVLLTQVGDLVELKLIDNETARGQFGFRLRRFYEKYDSIIKEGREWLQFRGWTPIDRLYKEWGRQ